MKSDINITRIKKSRISEVDFNNLSFGEIFADHMYQLVYKNGKWQQPSILPYGELSFQPSMSALHYGQVVFEGMKAFWYKNGKINLFRVKDHYQRFIRSCRRVSIPDVNEDLFFQGLKMLIYLDKDWIPKEKYKSLYIRPFVFATDPYLGVRSSYSYKLLIISCPVGSYYKNGMKPVNLTTMPEYTRGIKGGLGSAKVPGNYAASILPAEKAKSRGYTQVLWLDGCEHKYIEEVGTMNIFFVVDNKLITPELNGSILEGVTRQSVLTLADEMGYKTEERQISIDEIMKWGKNGSLREAFGTGTAAVISPVGKIHHMGDDIILNNGNVGPVSKKLYDHITDLHYGDINDTHEWCYVY